MIGNLDCKLACETCLKRFVDGNSQAPCKRSQLCWMLRSFPHPVACCCELLGVVAQNLKLVKP